MIAASYSKPLVIDFTDPNLAPCQMIGPIFEAHAKNFPELAMVRCDVYANPEAAEAAEIESIPTFKVYKDGV